MISLPLPISIRVLLQVHNYNFAILSGRTLLLFSTRRHDACIQSSPSIIALPAQTHKERVVGLRAVLDPSQKSHGSVLLQTLLELQHVQVLHRDPTEYRPEKNTL